MSHTDEKDLTSSSGEARIEPVMVEIDPVEEKKVLRKLDTYVISILGCLYLLSFLDRSNIGNANVAGLSTDLGLVGNQYGTAVSIVYATYVTFEPVYANLLKIITPKILLSVSTFCWGVLTIATAWSTNYHGLITIRILLGATEAGLFPCVNKIGRRLSFIYVCAALSGAFGGLLAYGLTQIKSSKLTGWQYLYIIEGSISTAFAPVAYLLVPNQVDQAWFLNQQEKALCQARTITNRRFYNPDDQFDWAQVKRALTDWKTWCQTVPAYVVAALSLLTFGHFSDKYQVRSPFIILALLFIVIGYIVLIAAPQVGVRYFGLFLVAVGLYPSTALNLAWCSGNAAGHFKRATASGTMQLIGNCAGAAIGYIFNAQTSPRYFKGLYVALGATILSMLLTAFQALMIKKENARREKLVNEGAEDRPELGDDNVHWTYYL
ncbi:uncharacterized protein IL334_005139 [Kwoniella shivajii]|uniref:Major facilitator superfamily (MFS) profile domain-containing protein n=1 Tax=Kwoniella shivajii TaxID=564305 RepID=A0ABZ1D498_9TREE|nr:hypothetical protein IL334_005139 [Kwoniella shivajii]